MSAIEPFLQRNRTFAESDARSAMTLRPPRAPIFVITCIDPRVDPAAFLGVGLGDAIVLRNAGGRVSEAAISDIAFISYLGEKLNPDASAPLEVAVIHHTQCAPGSWPTTPSGTASPDGPASTTQPWPRKRSPTRP